MWEQLIPQLIVAATPIIAGIIRRQQEETGKLPTDAEIIAEFQGNIAKYLGEGEAWKAAHPEG